MQIEKIDKKKLNKKMLSCFKDYDVRGELGEEFNSTLAYRIARSFALKCSLTKVVVGRDNRPTSDKIQKYVIKGLINEGVEVLDLGLCGTEEMYFATAHYNADAGIEVTASHNPLNYNGLKFIGKNSSPITSNQLAGIHDLTVQNILFEDKKKGKVLSLHSEAKRAFVEKVVSFLNVKNLKPMKILVNCGNGTAGPTFDAIALKLKQLGFELEFKLIYHEPDGNFPNGIPNPLLVENQVATSQAVLRCSADFGIAFDGDFDRCFFFDERGKFINSEYIVGLLAAVFLKRETGSKIIHDPRVVWNVQDIAKELGGFAVKSRTGHSFMKQAMRREQAIYGGEMSAHHYFQDFFYCDSGMIPWLLICELINNDNKTLSELVASRRKQFPSSGEMNFKVKNSQKTIKSVISHYEKMAVAKEDLDGKTLVFNDWRFNLRQSNTEAVIRLNIETYKDQKLLLQKKDELELLLRKFQ